MIRVLHVITGLNVGGAERFLSRMLSASKNDDAVLVIVKSDGHVFRSINALGCSVRVLCSNPVAGLKFAKEFDPELIVSWMYHGNLLGSLLGLFFNKPVSWNIRHSVADINNEKFILQLVIRIGAFFSGKASSIVFNSEIARKQHLAIGYQNRNMSVIRNGVLLSNAVARKRRLNHFVIGHFGRFHPMKDHACFIECCSVVAREVKNARFVMAGKCVDLSNKYLINLVNASGYKSRFQLLGLLDDEDQFFDQIDVLVVSSAWGESLPNVILEAMMRGIFVISTDVGDARFVLDGVGYIVEPNQPEQISEAIMKYYMLGSTEKLAFKSAMIRKIQQEYDLGIALGHFQQRWDDDLKGARKA